MSSGMGWTQRAIHEYLAEHDSATIWELTETLANSRGQRYAETVGGESVIRRAVRRLYEDGRLVSRTDGSAVRYATADDVRTGDGWTAYMAEPRPKELAAMLAAAVEHLDQTDAGTSEKEYEAAVHTLRDLAAAAAERGLYPVGGASR